MIPKIPIEIYWKRNRQIIDHVSNISSKLLSSTTNSFLKIIENQNLCHKQTMNIKTNTVKNKNVDSYSKTM
jgi:hypothetical protein